MNLPLRYINPSAQFVQSPGLPATSETPGGRLPDTKETEYGGVPPNGSTWFATKLPTVWSPNVPNPLDSALLGLEMNTAKVFETDPLGPVTVAVSVPVCGNGVP